MRIRVCEERHPSGGPGFFVPGRAEEVLPALLEQYRQRVQLIYLDPPFGTGETFYIKLKSGGERVALPAFSDQLDPKTYVAWMRPILEHARELLTPSGSIYLHIDYRMNAHMRLLLDEVFGQNNFMNEIVWPYRSGGRSTRYFPRKHDVILFYRKSAKVYFNIRAVGRPRGSEKRNHMKRFIDESGRVCFSIRSGGRVYVYPEDSPVYPSDVWSDIAHLQQRDGERVGYATQKPEALLKRIILASSREGELVADFFSGSGTTASVAMQHGRRYLACDASPIAQNILRARMLKNASALSLLDGAHEMRLVCPAEQYEATPACSLFDKHGKTMLRISQAGFDEKHPLVYAALGYCQGDVFHTVQADCRPRLPLAFDISDTPEPVVQVCDALGRQAFFTALDEARKDG